MIVTRILSIFIKNKTKTLTLKVKSSLSDRCNSLFIAELGTVCFPDNWRRNRFFPVLK